MNEYNSRLKTDFIYILEPWKILFKGYKKIKSNISNE